MNRATLARWLNRTGLASLTSRVLRWSGVICLNYHRIGDGSQSPFDHGIWSAGASEFDAQVSYLKAHFDVIAADDLPAALARGKGRYALITFDDGYLDNYTAAFPVLQRHRVAATFFIATGFIDNPRLPWWDEIAWMVRSSKHQRIEPTPFVPAPVVMDEPNRERAVNTFLQAYKATPSPATESLLNGLGQACGTGRYDHTRLKDFWMTWDMLRQMRAAGMSVGGHTVHHPVLTQLSPEGQWQEVSGCGRRLEEELHEPMRYFSYPIGKPHAFNDDSRECMRRAGVRFAFSYYGGIRCFGEWDDYDVRRLPVETDMTRDYFRAMVRLPQVFGRPRIGGPPAPALAQ